MDILLKVISLVIAGAVALGSTIVYVEAKFATDERVDYVEKRGKDTREDIKEIKTKIDKMYICLLTKDCKP